MKKEYDGENIKIKNQKRFGYNIVKMTEQRQTKTENYLELAQILSKRATCLRRRYGAIIVNNDAIAGTGYCGSPRGKPNCTEIGQCEREKQKVKSGERYELCRSVHAEMNAVINAARTGANILGGTIYISGFDAKTNKPCNAEPCIMCKRVIINAGLEKVIFQTENGIKTIRVNKLIKNNSC